jgi:hypothetical protein
MPSTLPRLFQDAQISQRTADGYIHATKMCEANGKKLRQYLALESSKAYLEELSGSVGILTEHLIHKITSGPNELRGTWIHPQAAIHLAMWCSPAFAVAVTAWVVEWMSGQGSQPELEATMQAQLHQWRQEHKEPYLEAYAHATAGAIEAAQLKACLTAFGAAFLPTDNSEASTMLGLIQIQATTVNHRLRSLSRILESYQGNYL